ASLGRLIQQTGVVESLSNGFNPDSDDGRWTRGLLLRARKSPDDVLYLRDRLLEACNEPNLYSIRIWIRKAGELILIEVVPPNPTPRWESDPNKGEESSAPENEPTPCSFGWLHLTDLHFGMSGQKCLWPNIEEAFFKDLKSLHGKAGP